MVSSETAAVLLAEGESRLESAGVSEARLNCSWLLAHALGVDRLSMLADRGLKTRPEQARNYRKFLARKAAGEPLAYIIGSQPFCGLSLKVDKRVLVPRPETEELFCLAADFALKNRRVSAPRILDFGAGSGALALAFAVRFPAAAVTAVDKSRRALSCAAENSRALGCADRIKFLAASSVRASGGPFDLIVSNPPYIPTGVIAGLDREVRSEPMLALDGGRDGLAVARMIITQAPAALAPGGALFMELGEAQSRAALALLEKTKWKTRKALKDFSGRQRFLFAVKK